MLNRPPRVSLAYGVAAGSGIGYDPSVTRGSNLDRVAMGLAEARARIAEARERAMPSTALVVAPTNGLQAPRSSSDYESEISELRRQLDLSHRLLKRSGAHVIDPMPPSHSANYRIERMSEGFWEGKYRASCGFRVIGLFDTRQEAWDSSCLDHAQNERRIQPRRS